MSDGRIDSRFPYGRHIALTCRNHPDKRWSTKNIDFIGARTIFYNLMSNPEMGAECDCPCGDLVILPEATDESAS